VNWYLAVLKKYAEFSGRARRKEYWMFFLFNVIILIVLSVLDSMFGTVSAQYGMGMLTGLYALATLVPNIAVTIRRLHDTDRSGWWILLGLIPLVGIVLLVFMCLEGTRGDNRFGPDPKAVAA
jgi:uncharacterized membrane protein YhaH (DUF805 family)